MFRSRSLKDLKKALVENIFNSKKKAIAEAVVAEKENALKKESEAEDKEIKNAGLRYQGITMRVGIIMMVISLVALIAKLSVKN